MTECYKCARLAELMAENSALRVIVGDLNAPADSGEASMMSVAAFIEKQTEHESLDSREKLLENPQNMALQGWNHILLDAPENQLFVLDEDNMRRLYHVGFMDCKEGHYNVPAHGLNNIEYIALSDYESKRQYRDQQKRSMDVDFENDTCVKVDEPANGNGGETNGIADGSPLVDELRYYADDVRYDYNPLDDVFESDERLSELCGEVADMLERRTDAPEGDAVDMLRKYVEECESANGKVGTRGKRLLQIADMVERDYVSREAYEDLRDEFVWETTFLHRIAKKCGTKDVPSLKAYVEQLEARVAEHESEERRMAPHDCGHIADMSAKSADCVCNDGFMSEVGVRADDVDANDANADSREKLEADDMPESDAVAILRKAAKCTSVNTSVGDVLRYNVPGNEPSAWQTEEDACEALADMVERDYVSRKAYEDLRFNSKV